MSDILAKLAGNKTIAQLAFKQIKKYIKDENITMICIYVDDKGEITAKQYTDPVAVLKQSDYLGMAERYSDLIDEHQKLLEELKQLKQLTNGQPE